MGKYITDPEGFGQFASTAAFKQYVDYVIRPSYVLHAQLGLLRRERPAELATATRPARDAYAFNVTFSNFLSARCAPHPTPNPRLWGASGVPLRPGLWTRREHAYGYTRHAPSHMRTDTHGARPA